MLVQILFLKSLDPAGPGNGGLSNAGNSLLYFAHSTVDIISPDDLVISIITYLE